MMSNEISSEAMRSLRDAAVRSDVTYTHVAQQTGFNRQSIPKMLRRSDLPIGTYFKLAEAMGADPLKLLTDARAHTAMQFETKGN